MITIKELLNFRADSLISSHIQTTFKPGGLHQLLWRDPETQLSKKNNINMGVCIR